MESAAQYLGVIVLGKIENTGENAGQLGVVTAKFVHYSDCQQLIIWLPAYGRDGYGDYRVIDLDARANLHWGRVETILNGSIQLLFDTLTWPPGNYILELDGPKGVCHQLHFQKLSEGITLPPTPVAALPQSEECSEDSLWRVYRDGFGNPIPNLDRALRDVADKRLTEIVNEIFHEAVTRIEIQGNARAGTITYVEDHLRLTFSYERGMSPCTMLIDIPSDERWEAATSTPLAKRREILNYLARNVRRDHGPTWRYEIRDREIAFFETEQE